MSGTSLINKKGSFYYFLVVYFPLVYTNCSDGPNWSDGPNCFLENSNSGGGAFLLALKLAEFRCSCMNGIRVAGGTWSPSLFPLPVIATLDLCVVPVTPKLRTNNKKTVILVYQSSDLQIKCSETQFQW